MREKVLIVACDKPSQWSQASECVMKNTKSSVVTAIRRQMNEGVNSLGIRTLDSGIRTLEELTILSHSLIMSVFTNAIEVWACAYSGIFCKRAWKYGYTRECSDVIQISDKQLWKKITATDTHCLTDLLPKKRTYQSLHQRGLDYMLPRFKSCFLNRSLFNFIKFNVCKESYTF